MLVYGLDRGSQRRTAGFCFSLLPGLQALVSYHILHRVSNASFIRVEVIADCAQRQSSLHQGGACAHVLHYTLPSFQPLSSVRISYRPPFLDKRVSIPWYTHSHGHTDTLAAIRRDIHEQPSTRGRLHTLSGASRPPPPGLSLPEPHHHHHCHCSCLFRHMSVLARYRVSLGLLNGDASFLPYLTMEPSRLPASWGSPVGV